MMEKILSVLLPVCFLAAFILRNTNVAGSTGKRIRSADPLLRSSIVFTSLCFATLIFSSYSDAGYHQFGAFTALRSPIATTLGFLLFAATIPMGWMFSGHLKSSWRVGVHREQETDLITTGAYRYVRNPYFLSYFLMFLGIWLVRPSLVQSVLVAAAATIFHCMVLREERHLLNQHGKAYERYRQSTGRYVPRFKGLGKIT